MAKHLNRPRFSFLEFANSNLDANLVSLKGVLFVQHILFSLMHLIEHQPESTARRLDEIDHRRVRLLRPMAILEDRMKRPEVGGCQSGFRVRLEFFCVSVSAMKASRYLQQTPGRSR